MMKRFLAIALVVVMALSFAACGGGTKCDNCGQKKSDVKDVMGFKICAECEEATNEALGELEDALGELGDKISEEEKSKIEAAKAELQEALKGEDIEAIKAKQEALQKEFFAVSEKLYKAQAEAAQQNGGANADTSANADNVYDADFTDVDDTK